MESLDILLEKNKAQLSVVIDGFISDYKKSYPEVRNMDTAYEYLAKHYNDYRHNVASLTTDVFHKLISERINDIETVRKVMEANSFNIGDLFVAIMKESGVRL